MNFILTEMAYGLMTSGQTIVFSAIGLFAVFSTLFIVGSVIYALDHATKRIIGVLTWLLLALLRPVRWMCFKILQVAVLAVILVFAAFLAAHIKGVPLIYLFNPPIRSYNGWD